MGCGVRGIGAAKVGIGAAISKEPQHKLTVADFQGTVTKLL